MATARRKALLGAAAVLVAAALGTYALLAASLPRDGGSATVPGLSADVDVELDGRAVPRIRAASLDDAFRALGFVHAQERFFQMDLTRRMAAGELAALMGRRALPLDRRQRAFEFRRRAAELLRRWPAEHVRWLEAYAQGVNAGLEDLGARPPEYWLLGAEPEPWVPEDSVLVLFAFCTMLSDTHGFERAQAVMQETLPPAVYAFLTPSTSRFDRPLNAPDDDLTGGYVPVPVPPPQVIDLRQRPAPRFERRLVAPPETGAASNQWAVAVERSAHGGAIVANDPHLPLRLPGPFYRAELYWPGGVARGVTVPGLPGVVIGATDRLAWGATVTYADQGDWVIVERDPRDPTRYRTPEGSEPFAVVKHAIEIAGEDEPELVETRATRWGPVLEEDHRGRPLALRATWLDPDGASIDLIGLMTAADVHAAVDVVREWRGPSLNWVLADSDGRVAWAVNGPVPRRVGFDGSQPVSWADGAAAWQGTLELPARVAPEDGVVLTANNRTLPADEAAAFGRFWMRPLRAKRADDLLRAERRFDEQALLAMQLDTRAEGYDVLRDVVLEVVPLDERDRLLVRARRHVAEWNGRADVDQPGFRILQLYYSALLERALGPLLAPAAEADERFVYRWPLADEALRRLLDERPAHLLTREHASWPAFLRSVLRDALAEVASDPRRPDLDAPWGDVNRLDVGHAFADLPVIGRFLRLPAVALPGSSVSLRRATPTYGAVFRMVVAPARPADGILQMAGGQSGHFLSPHFMDQQADWAAGAPAPFLAGETAARFRLRPAR
ncbi:MAG TPA: penicillin acylase family protein [Gammaproteobacteria bacterium]